MSNNELVDYYKYCMSNRFGELRHKGVHIHPDARRCSVYVGENSIHILHTPNELFLLYKMFDRLIGSSFLDQCWWMSQNIFQTSISLPIKKNEPQYFHPEKCGIKETIKYNGEVFTFLASGSKRKTFLSPCKMFVIKVPMPPEKLGLIENNIEAETYIKNPNSIYAKCEIIENGWLKMEYVQPKYFTKDDDYPEWTLSIAEHQVGYTLDGRLVAYDYGSDI